MPRTSFLLAGGQKGKTPCCSALHWPASALLTGVFPTVDSKSSGGDTVLEPDPEAAGILGADACLCQLLYYGVALT